MKRIILNITILIYSVCSAVTLIAQHPEQEKKITELIENFNFSEAIQLADSYLISDSANTNLLFLKSKALSGLFQYKKSYEVLKKAYSLDTNNLMILAELSNLCQKKGDKKNAILYSKKACNIKPQNSYFHLQLADLYFSSENFDKCLEVLNHLYPYDSSNQYIARTIGDCYYEQKKNDSAVYWYEKILHSSPFDIYATQKLANIYIRTEKFEKGLELTDSYIKNDTGLNPVLKLNAYFYYLLKDYNTAVYNFKKCLLFGDSSLFVYKNLGLTYYKKEVFDSAELFFRQAYLLDTNDGETCFYFGVSAARSLLPDTGIRYLNKTLSLVMPSEKFSSNIYFELAEAYNISGKTDTALVILEKIQCIYPENKRMLFRIAYQWDYYLKDPVNALVYYELFLKDKPNVTTEYGGGTELSFEAYARNRVVEIKNKISQKK